MCATLDGGCDVVEDLVQPAGVDTSLRDDAKYVLIENSVLPVPDPSTKGDAWNACPSEQHIAILHVELPVYVAAEVVELG